MMVNTRDKQMNSGFASLRGGMLGMWAMVLLLMLGMVSCKPSLPHDILSKGKMTDILYDYHIALAMAQVDGDNAKSIARRVQGSWRPNEQCTGSLGWFGKWSGRFRQPFCHG